MEKINFYQPQKLVFGEGCFSQFVRDLKETKLKRLFILTVPFLRDQIDQAFGSFAECNITISINSGLNTEPGFSHYYQLLEEARVFQPDGVIGIGGGSVLDLSKLLAAMICNDQKLEEVVGIGLLNQRALFLACLPTTSGTGSEVSPNAILLNESDNMKKGIISPFLVPDYTCIDPLLTIGVPPDLTASTAIDALTHCLEAFTNRFAHPMVDLYALEGIRLISKNLVKGFNDGSDIEARTALSLGSLYGGLCLGPVNTAAVHALSYPLGSQFKVPHGLANALLLPCDVTS
jgi:alcohol dehydrogenase class IV